jgi:hypothetical protein
MLLRFLALLALAPILTAQILTGWLEGTIFAPDGRPRANVDLTVTGGTGFEITVKTDDQGRFTLVLPYGLYRVNGVPVRIDPLAATHADLVLNPAAPAAPSPPGHPNLARRAVNPEPFSLQGSLLSLDPTVVSEPLDFIGLSDNRLSLLSFEGFTWTATEFLLQGLNATDSYQPGRPVMLPDVQALETTVVRSAFSLTTSESYGAEAGVVLAQPIAGWHGAVQSNGAPPAGSKTAGATGYDWLTRDHAEIGGPLTHWSDLFASGTGQWSSQTLPLAIAGPHQRSRMLYGNIRGRVRAGARDFLDALYSGSRIDLFNGAVPVGMEPLVGRRASPEFALPGGFANQAEVDHLDFVQMGWTHRAFELRYGYQVAHLDTREASVPVPDQSRIELLGSYVTGAPPFGNFAIRTRHQIEAAWQSESWRALGITHHLTAGGGWSTASPRNRFSAPSNLNLITANGAPAYVIEFDTPTETSARINDASIYAADHLAPAAGLSIDVALLADRQVGQAVSPAQAAEQPARIVWNNLAPRATFSWQPPHLHGFTLQAGWFRLLAPLAGRYLDFADPNSLGGGAFQWIDRNGDGWFEPGEQGPLLMRFGGPYSSIAPSLRRPYADEIHVGAEMPIRHIAIAGIRFFRRDEKRRLAAIDTGVPAQAFTPLTILDPGPDGIPGTFDDRPITVWAQNPATLGQDRYLLTNEAGRRMLNTGLSAEVAAAFGGLTIRASFVAEKSYGPTNPGNAVFENDSGVLGALFLDPNTAINAANRTFVDRAFLGKLQAVYRLPRSLGGIQFASIAGYVDGLVFARQLLVTGLPQGPFLVNATVRGSPEGGNRAQYVPNWNLRASRGFRLPFGNLLAAADLMNVTNAGHSIQQSDVTGPNFNLRLPVEIQPARYVRLELRYDF